MAARSLTDPADQVLDLVALADEPGSSGQLRRAAALARRCETMTRSIVYANRRANALTRVAAVLARAGEYRQAETIALAITGDSYAKADALVSVAEGLARAGQLRNAETIACSIAFPDLRAKSLVQVANILSKAGQHPQAQRLLGKAEAAARSTDSIEQESQALKHVAGGLANAGQYQQAAKIARSISATAPAVRP